MDEFQQLISDNVELIFEQIRDQGVTMVIAHQTPGQLRRQGSDLSETVESCTAVKQVFRISDIRIIKNLEEASGNARYHSLAWTQQYDMQSALGEDPLLDPSAAMENMVQVGEENRPRLDRNTILDVSADPLASLVRFSFGSGYTQFGAYITPIISQYHISNKVYKERKKTSWPTGTGTVLIPYPTTTPPRDFRASPPALPAPCRQLPGLSSSESSELSRARSQCGSLCIEVSLLR